ncbi:RNA-directed DNA polymerase from mobile element jockey [Trichonephila clavipes]|nr:RNA-directed DNA polymerase from mobile element jockey [Trichonephila clavipes]
MKNHLGERLTKPQTSCSLEESEYTKQIILQWIPGHYGVTKNEFADHLANKEASIQQSEFNSKLNFGLSFRDTQLDEWISVSINYFLNIENTKNSVDLLNAADDGALIFLNSRLPTHTSFSYGTSEALDITLVSPELPSHCDWDILSNIGSDHLPILINVQINRKTVTSHKKFWKFKKANWDCFRRITEGYFDKRITKDNLEQEDPGLRTLIIKRNALHRQRTLTGDQKDKTELNKLNASIKQLYIKLKREAWTGLCSNIDAKTPNRKLWKLAQSPSYNQPQNIPCNTVMTLDGKAAPDDKTAANVLEKFYKGVGYLKFNQNDVILINRSKRMIHICRTSSSGNHIFINKFTLMKLNFAIRAIDLRKSPGPECIHGFMIGRMGPHGMQKLLDIFNFSWKIGRLPSDWKRAIIIPILKPGKGTSTSASYRTIALPSFVCKPVFLKLWDVPPLGGRIRDAHNKKSTNHKVAALLDISRAFDRVWRQLLITKLRDYFSIRGRAPPWISDFFCDRSIRVKYNNCLSDPFAIRQGVPQGSVLSPVLFSLCITVIEKLLAKHCEVGIFADDIIVWSSDSDVSENELKLNRGMEEAHSFAEIYKLIFNASKSLTTFISTNRHLFNYQPKISMNGIQLCYIKNAKYLGYTLDQ